MSRKNKLLSSKDEENYKQLAEAYSDNVNRIADNCNESTRQLISIMTTAGLAFLAISTAAFGDSSMMQSFNAIQRYIILGAITTFALSVIFGVIYYIVSINADKGRYRVHDSISDDLYKASTEKDIEKISKRIENFKEKNGRNSGIVFVWIQAILFIIGIIITTSYIFTIVFSNTNSTNSREENHLNSVEFNTIITSQ